MTAPTTGSRCSRGPACGKTAHTGMHHTAFEYPSYDDLMRTYMRLKGLGIVPRACLDHGLTTSLYYTDPDGNMVELQVDNFGDWEQSAEWMRTSEEFRRDPIGTFFDPDRVLAAYQGGAKFEQLRVETRAGKYSPAEPPSPSSLNLP